MLIQEAAEPFRTIESDDDLAETRLEAIGYVFHGTLLGPTAKRVRSGANLLHFARCPKIERAGETEVKIWFQTIRIAKKHLDEQVGDGRWKWCKLCEREVTQRLLNE